MGKHRVSLPPVEPAHEDKPEYRHNKNDDAHAQANNIDYRLGREYAHTVVSVNSEEGEPLLREFAEV